jgi:hypothetical protein
MITAAQAREELDKVTSLVQTARKLLPTGALVDLSAIRDRVNAICAAVQAMPREDGQSLRDELLATIERLDKLAIDLQDQLDQTTTRLAGDL